MTQYVSDTPAKVIILRCQGRGPAINLKKKKKRGRKIGWPEGFAGEREGGGGPMFYSALVGGAKRSRRPPNWGKHGRRGRGRAKSCFFFVNGRRDERSKIFSLFSSGGDDEFAGTRHLRGQDVAPRHQRSGHPSKTSGTRQVRGQVEVADQIFMFVVLFELLVFLF
jgi:hypothetical protein